MSLRIRDVCVSCLDLERRLTEALAVKPTSLVDAVIAPQTTAARLANDALRQQIQESDNRFAVLSQAIAIVIKDDFHFREALANALAKVQHVTPDAIDEATVRIKEVAARQREGGEAKAPPPWDYPF